MNKNFLKALGPGLICAGASVGVSHLVQSTRTDENLDFELAEDNSSIPDNVD